MTKYREGDEVTVRGVLSPDSDGLIEQAGYVNVRFENHRSAFHVAIEELATHTPKPFKPQVGDMVTWGLRTYGGRLLFLGKGLAAVLDRYGEPRLVAIANLEPWTGN